MHAVSATGNEEFTRLRDALACATAEREAAEQKYQALVQSAPDAILIADFETAFFVEANPAACELFGHSVEEFRLKKGRMLHPTDEHPLVDRISQDIVECGRAWHPNVRMHRKDGGVFFAELRINVYRVAGRELYVTIVRDVTARVERESELEASYRALQDAQAKLVQASRLSAVGQLGAGIAHELNQPITAIQGFAERLRRDLPKDLRGADELDVVIREARRMARIVDNMRAFARARDLEPEPLDPMQPLDDALMLLAEQLRVHGIEIEREADACLPRVIGDRARLQQVFLNLITNARDALDELPPEAQRRLLLTAHSEADAVVLCVEDSGRGIAPEHAARLFEPFFTTKGSGHGMGLGLSIAYGIVEDHGGEIRHEAAAGGGARFVVRLPRAVGQQHG